MNQSSREVSRIVQAQERFEQALRGAYDDPWWREFVKTTKDFRDGKMEVLATSVNMNQREEDVLRGEIRALTWILALDRYGETHQTVKEQANGRPTS